MLASLLFPYDDDAPALIDQWLTELEAENCIRRYEVEGQHYLQITNWLQHQKIDKPSKSYLPPLESIREDSPKAREHSSEDLGSRIKDLGRDLGPKEGTPRESSEPLFAPIPETPILPESTLSGVGRIEKARSLWNSHAPTIGPACRLLSIQFRPEDTSDCLRTMSGYTDEEIAEAMGNYEKILASPGHEVKSRYQSFVGFIRGGVEKFVSEADPWTAYKRRLSFAEQDEADTKRALAEVFERNQEAEG